MCDERDKAKEGAEGWQEERKLNTQENKKWKRLDELFRRKPGRRFTAGLKFVSAHQRLGWIRQGKVTQGEMPKDWKRCVSIEIT